MISEFSVGDTLFYKDKIIIVTSISNRVSRVTADTKTRIIGIFVLFINSNIPTIPYDDFQYDYDLIQDLKSNHAKLLCLK